MQGMLFRRGGTLEDSLRLAISERPNEISALFSMASPGATTQEFGAISAPTRAQALTIPVGEQLHASGRRRYRSVAESRQDFSLFRHGDTLMGHQHGAPSFDTKVQWLLRRHVTVPARPVIGPEVVVAAETVANQCAGRIADLLAGDF
jgi:hypothetical protein